MNGNSILIIGAGIAGLATGCYAQMSDYQTRIVEMHILPGGVCTSWRRKGYTIDGCIHHLAGCRPESRLYPIWAALGAMPRPMLYPDDLVRVEAPDGRAVTVYTDLDRLEDHLKSIAPADKERIEQYVQAARDFRAVDMMDLTVAGTRETLATLPRLLKRFRWLKASMSSWGAGFRDPFLRQAAPTFQYDTLETPVALHLNMLAQCDARNYGWPEGGSLAFARDIARRYEALGGEILYKAHVTKILVENDRAVGVRLADGTEYRAETIISTAPGYNTVFGMLDGRYVSKAQRQYYSHPTDTIGMGLQISLGVTRDLTDEPHSIVRFLEQPVQIADRTHDRLDLELFGFDPTLVPQGKGVLKCVLTTGYRYWKELRRDLASYQAEKERAAQTVVDLLEPRFPGLKRQIEVIDVATPVTTERYTGNGPGFEGSLGQMLVGMVTGRQTLPGLSNFYMAGQWVSAPGLPPVVGSARSVVRMLCKRDRKSFVCSVQG